MAGRPVSKNNVIAGSFLVISLILAIAVSVYISGAQERLIPSHEYTVRFSLADGAAGLKPGSKVTLGGLNVGRVVDLTVASTPGQPSLDARIRVRTGINLYESAMVFLERPLLGAGSEINISDVGTHQSGAGFTGASDSLEPGEMVMGRIAPPAFLAQAGYGPQQAQKVRVAIDQLADLAGRLDGMVERLDPQIDPIVKSASSALDDVRSITGDVRQKLPGWTDTLDHTLASVDSAADKAGPLLDDTRAVVADVQAAIDENRPHVDRIVASVESAADKIDHQTVDRLNEGLQTASTALDRAGKVVADIAGYINEEMPSIRKIVGNFRLASDQLKLVTIEVRRNPWRLLYRPETKELESEMLYDAARSYAEAVSDLRAASESLEAAASTPDPALTVVDRQSLESLHRQITDAFQKYQEAEKAFLQRAEQQSK